MKGNWKILVIRFLTSSSRVDRATQLPRVGPSLVFLVLVYCVNPVLGEIDGAMLLGEWCLIHQSMNGHDFETLSVKALRDKIKAKPGQTYDFLDTETVALTVAELCGKHIHGIGDNRDGVRHR